MMTISLPPERRQRLWSDRQPPSPSSSSWTKSQNQQSHQQQHHVIVISDLEDDDIPEPSTKKQRLDGALETPGTGSSAGFLEVFEGSRGAGSRPKDEDEQEDNRSDLATLGTSEVGTINSSSGVSDNKPPPSQSTASLAKGPLPHRSIGGTSHISTPSRLERNDKPEPTEQADSLVKTALEQQGQAQTEGKEGDASSLNSTSAPIDGEQAIPFPQASRPAKAGPSRVAGGGLSEAEIEDELDIRKETRRAEGSTAMIVEDGSDMEAGTRSKEGQTAMILNTRVEKERNDELELVQADRTPVPPAITIEPKGTGTIVDTIEDLHIESGPDQERRVLHSRNDAGTPAKASEELPAKTDERMDEMETETIQGSRANAKGVFPTIVRRPLRFPDPKLPRFIDISRHRHNLPVCLQASRMTSKALMQRLAANHRQSDSRVTFMMALGYAPNGRMGDDALAACNMYPDSMLPSEPALFPPDNSERRYYIHPASRGWERIPVEPTVRDKTVVIPCAPDGKLLRFS